MNQNDYLEMTGNVGIAAPFVYQAAGDLNLRDLGAFNDLLKNAGQPADLRGSLDINFSGKGDLQNPIAQLRVLGDQIKYRGLPIQNIDIETRVENSMARIETGRINLDALNYLDFNGEAGIKGALPLQGERSDRTPGFCSV